MKRRQFNILLWDMTANTIKNYDVLPYLRECIYKEPEFHEYEDLKNFIDQSARSQFWSRCEYEILVSDWPKQQKTIKIDGY